MRVNEDNVIICDTPKYAEIGKQILELLNAQTHLVATDALRYASERLSVLSVFYYSAESENVGQ
jgi:hypothetical protein